MAKKDQIIKTLKHKNFSLSMENKEAQTKQIKQNKTNTDELIKEQQFNTLKNTFQQVKNHFQNFDKTLIVKKTPDVAAEVAEKEIKKLANEDKASIFVIDLNDGESVENLFKQIRSRILRKKGEKPSKFCG